MPFMTIGPGGRLLVDGSTQRAQQLFGLGRRKRRKHRQPAPAAPPPDTSPAVVDTTPGPGVPMAVQATPVQYAAPSPGPIVITDAPPPPQAAAPATSPEEAVAAQANTEDQPSGGGGGGGYTIDPSEEANLWTRGRENAEGNAPPPSSVEGNACGGYIATGPSPKQRDFEGAKSATDWMNPKRYSPLNPRPRRTLGGRACCKGLGQDDPFWYRPQQQFEEVPVPTSPEHPNEQSLHVGSKWGGAWSKVKAATQDPFAIPQRRKHRRPGGAAKGLPF